MQTIKGIITNIKEIKTDLSHKFLVTLLQFDNNQLCFVEFRGKVMMQVFKPYKKDDHVCITAELEGKISKNTEMHYNNLVGKNIKTL